MKQKNTPQTEVPTRVGKRQGPNQFSPVIYTCPNCKTKVMAADFGNSGCGYCNFVTNVVRSKTGS